jgi:hypothetical protein
VTTQDIILIANDALRKLELAERAMQTAVRELVAVRDAIGMAARNVGKQKRRTNARG